jgi:hypothetical protein
MGNGSVVGDLALGQGVRREQILAGSVSDEKPRTLSGSKASNQPELRAPFSIYEMSFTQIGCL